MSQELRFGLVPVHDDAASRESVAQLVDSLGRTLGARGRAVSCKDPEELARRFAAGELDLAWSSPTLALTQLHRGTPVVASVRQGVAFYHGVLFVPRDSEVRGPMHLRGRSVAWVAKTSASGYLFARVALASIGLEPGGLFAREVFLGSHGAVARAVLGGEVDVGATFAVFDHGDATQTMIHSGFMEEEGGDDARILFCTPPIPSDLVVAAPAAIERWGTALRAALLELPAQVPVALRQTTGAEGFQACRPRFLDELRVQLQDASVLGLLDE